MLIMGQVYLSSLCFEALKQRGAKERTNSSAFLACIKITLDLKSSLKRHGHYFFFHPKKENRIKCPYIGLWHTNIYMCAHALDADVRLSNYKH